MNHFVLHGPHAQPAFVAPERREGTGFTLLELMVVMVIMGIVMAVQLPRLGGQLTGSSLRSAARAVGALAYSARFRAADTGCPHVLVLDGRENQVRLFDEDGRGPLLSRRLPRGVSFDRMESEGRAAENNMLRITFYPQGTATPAELLLSGSERRHLLLTVSAADGAVREQAR